MNKNKGITLIALIVTIIVLLILATISISIIVGQNGILSKAKIASEQTKSSQDEEDNRLSSYNTYIDNIGTSRGDTANINNGTSPILLTEVVLPYTGSGSRAAGIYKASSSSYTKTDTEKALNYLSYTQGVGWTVLKSGNYLLNSILGAYYSSSGADVQTSLLLGSDTIIIARSYVDGGSTQGPTAGNLTVYLKQGSIIDYQYANTAAVTYSTSSLKIYAMFE